MTLPEKARHATRSTWLTRLARGGLLARGLVHGAVAVLALQIAFGKRVEKADKKGALEVIAAQPFGRWLIAAVAIGLGAYAAWRFVMAVAGPGKGGAKKRWGHRAGYAVRGLLYAALALTAARLVAGTGGEDRFEEVDATAKLMSLPLGRVLVGLVGAGFLLAGGRAVWRAAAGKYRDHLALYRMSANEKRVATWTAAIGLVARGLVWALVALFLLRAAIFSDPEETVGLDGALRAVASVPLGQVLLACVAGGLLAYGLFGLVEARYRKVSS